MTYIYTLFKMGFIDRLPFYQDIIEEIFVASGPDFKNMDNEDLIYTTSTYTIEPSYQEGIIETFINSKIFDCEEGRESFLWVGTPEVTSLMETVIKGHITIKHNTLVTECNSSGRDSQLRGLLIDLFKKSIKHQKTESNPIDSMDPFEMNHEGEGTFLNLDELPNDARNQIIEHLESTYMKWADQSIPALNHLTPRESVKNPEGRKQVINLIKDWENKTAHMENKQFEFDFNKLRANLGLSLE